MTNQKNDESEFSLESERAAPQALPELFKSRQDTAATFRRALATLGAIGNAAAVPLFDGRATQERIRDWKRGHRLPPAWAWGQIATLLEHRAHGLLKVAALCRSADVAPGRRNDIHIKEKARRLSRALQERETPKPQLNP